MIKPLSSTAMFWIGVAAVVLSIVFGTLVPTLIAPYQAGGSPTLGDVIALVPVVTRVAEGIGYAFVAGAFVVRHLEEREAVDARRSVHFVGRAAREDDRA